MGLKLDYIDGQTPLDEDEKLGLLIKTISTREELDEFEQANIQQAVEWTLKNKFTTEEILSEDFVLLIHRRMFGEVWNWAGTIRKTNKNIGVDKFQISAELRTLMDDCKYWIENQTFGADEITIQFSHRIVKIHVFSNGNGRHSRLIADIIASNLFNKPVFTWGGTNLSKKSDIRKQYLNAIYEADKGNIQPLIDFARM
ncbi:MAG: mobile mystery protein B [Bacteroidales bacterium]